MPKESTKATITSFAGTPLVRVVDGSNSRNISPANLVAETGAQTALDGRYLLEDGSNLSDSGVESDLDDRYAPTSVYVPAGSMVSYTGSPGNGQSSGQVYWSFDASSSEAIGGGGFFIPPSWTTVNVYVWIVTLAATSGNAVIAAAATQLTDGALSSGLTSIGSTGGETVEIPSTNNRVKRILLTSSDAAFSGPAHVRAFRLGADAADTYGADIGFLGVEFEGVIVNP